MKIRLFKSLTPGFHFWGPHLFVEPSSHHHWDVGVPFDGMVTLAKAMHLPTGFQILRFSKEKRKALSFDWIKIAFLFVAFINLDPYEEVHRE